MDILAIGEPLMEFSEVEDMTKRKVYLPGYGGDTSNFAIAAARQGAHVGYLTSVGVDAFGEQFIKLWEAEGVKTTYVKQDSNAHTGLYFITHTENGHHFVYHRKGSAASRLGPEDITESMILGLKILHVSGISQAISNSCCDAIFKAIEIAKENRVTVSYDPNLRLKLWPLSRAKAVIEATAIQSDIFMPSLEDAQQLTGKINKEDIADYYLNLGIKLVVLKLGKDGVYIATKMDRYQVKGFKVETVDATGAGDTFDGAFLSQILLNKPLVEAAEYANAAAALSTTGYGAVFPIPKKEAVSDFLKSVTGI